MRSPYSLPLSIALRLLGLATVVLLCSLAIRQMMGDIVFGRSRYGTAEQQQAFIREALEIDPVHGPAWYQLALHSLVTGNLDQALDALEHAQTTMPSYLPHDLHAEALYARAYSDVTTRYEALEAFDHALSIFPQDNKMLNRAGRIALWLGDVERARAYMQRADVDQILRYDWRMQNPDTISLQGDIEFASGNLQEAEIVYRRLMFLQPNDPEAKFLIAMVLLAQDEHSLEAYNFIRVGWNTALTSDRAVLAVGQAMNWLDWDFTWSLAANILERRASDDSETSPLDPVIERTLSTLMMTTVWRGNHAPAEDLLFETAGPVVVASGNVHALRILIDQVAREIAMHRVSSGDFDQFGMFLNRVWGELAVPMAGVPGGLEPFTDLDATIQRMMLHRPSMRDQLPLIDHCVQRLNMDPRFRAGTLEALERILVSQAQRDRPLRNCAELVTPLVNSPMARDADVRQVIVRFGQALISATGESQTALAIQNVDTLITRLGAAQFSSPVLDEALLGLAQGLGEPSSVNEDTLLARTLLASALVKRAKAGPEFEGAQAAHRELMNWLRENGNDLAVTSMTVGYFGALGHTLRGGSALPPEWQESYDEVMRTWAEALLLHDPRSDASSAMVRLLGGRSGGEQEPQWITDLHRRYNEARQ